MGDLWKAFLNSSLINNKNISLKSIILLFLLFTGLLSLLYHLPIPLLRNHLTEVFAIIFLFTPWLYFYLRKETDFTTFNVRKNSIAWGIIVSVVILGIYWIAHLVWFKTQCANDTSSLGRNCLKYRGSFIWPFGISKTINLLLVNLIAVALPEEFFYRGFIMPLLLKTKQLNKMSSRWKIFSVLIIQAVLFALGHFLVDGNPIRLAVFFPGFIFGAIALKSGSITAPIIFHGLANFVSEIIENGYFVS
jgi:membrane protease YdiL (CAAX protease family)